eukprot:324213-Rhodomonas_salina.2
MCAARGLWAEDAVLLHVNELERDQEHVREEHREERRAKRQDLRRKLQSQYGYAKLQKLPRLELHSSDSQSSESSDSSVSDDCNDGKQLDIQCGQEDVSVCNDPLPT